MIKKALLSYLQLQTSPKVPFPVQFEDVYTALKWFLDPQILESYGVDPGRVGISGDKRWRNLAAA